MNTTRTILCLIALAPLAMLAGGCVESSTSQVGAINTEPLTIDAAMQKRSWEPVTAHYENGDVKTCSTGLAYSSDPSRDERNNYYADSGTYFVNLVTMPYTMFQQRDGVVSTGVQLPPSYTAVPPLPGTPESLPVAETVVTPVITTPPAAP